MQSNPPSMTLTAGEFCRRLTLLATWVDGVMAVACSQNAATDQTITDEFLITVMQAMESTSLTQPPWKGGACPAPLGDE